MFFPPCAAFHFLVNLDLLIALKSDMKVVSLIKSRVSSKWSPDFLEVFIFYNKSYLALNLRTSFLTGIMPPVTLLLRLRVSEGLLDLRKGEFLSLDSSIGLSSKLITLFYILLLSLLSYYGVPIVFCCYCYYKSI